MRLLTSLFVVSLCISTFACGDDEPEGTEPAGDGDRVFSAVSSSDADASRLEGIWEAKTPRRQSGLESIVRLELRADHVVAAVRCTPTGGEGETAVLGKVGRADVSPTAIAVPEEVRVSKSIGKSYCGVVVHAAELPTCDLRKPASERSWCFELSNGTLTVREDIAAVAYTKVTD